MDDFILVLSPAARMTARQERLISESPSAIAACVAASVLKGDKRHMSIRNKKGADEGAL
ncbi:hypothetical protein IFT66_05300 [Rhizobium sp. CFBP 13726]|uniref:hypothetical protein n=1 Tax=Rhizobium sp. CFBP 13726 TaxID=2775296 RepID=UPI00178242D1|nr:hypothetical protein [Rhizobium sp. CFBP 13726]MBD8650488.1 hypothetical protein [Rhizobium sp. CFBP 13726]